MLYCYALYPSLLHLQHCSMTFWQENNYKKTLRDAAAWEMNNSNKNTADVCWDKSVPWSDPIVIYFLLEWLQMAWRSFSGMFKYVLCIKLSLQATSLPEPCQWWTLAQNLCQCTRPGLVLADERHWKPHNMLDHFSYLCAQRQAWYVFLVESSLMPSWIGIAPYLLLLLLLLWDCHPSTQLGRPIIKTGHKNKPWRSSVQSAKPQHSGFHYQLLLPFRWWCANDKIEHTISTSDSVAYLFLSKIVIIPPAC